MRAGSTPASESASRAARAGQIVDRRLVVAAEAGRSDPDNGYVSHLHEPSVVGEILVQPLLVSVHAAVETATRCHFHTRAVSGIRIVR